MLERTGVELHDDPEAPYIQGTEEGLAEMMAFLEEQGAPDFPRND